MRIAIIGSRNFKDYNLLVETVNNYTYISEIISGGAKGADTLAKRYALEKSILLTEFLPNKIHGRGMYHDRNRQIVAACDLVIAFWDRKSKGTKYTIDFAKKNGKEVVLIDC